MERDYLKLREEHESFLATVDQEKTTIFPPLQEIPASPLVSPTPTTLLVTLSPTTPLVTPTFTTPLVTPALEITPVAVVVAEPFRFSLSIGNYTQYSASNLDEFLRDLKIVPTQSLEFHLYRGDFEGWLKFMKSDELASAFGDLRVENLHGEALRNRLLEVAQSLRLTGNT